MLRISTVALLIFETGFLQVVFLIKSLQVEPGQSAFMWCSHNIHVPGDLYWFKQTDGAVPIIIMRFTYTQIRQKGDKEYLNHVTKERLILYHFNQSTNLIINNVKVSDSGFYFCGAAEDQIKFSDGTRLIVKEKNVTSEKNDTRTLEKDQEQSPVSTEECSEHIFYILTLLFGGIIVFVCIIALILAIIREHKRQKHKKVTECQARKHNKQNDSIEYASVKFKRRPKTAGRHTEDTIAVYTDATET